MSYGVMTDYDRNDGRKRDYLRVWSGPFYSVWEADGVSLPRGDGYMLTTYNGERVRVTCPTPRTDENYREVDAAIDAALRAHYRNAGPTLLEAAQASGRLEIHAVK
jgi:hypothetical protein